jgi:hypothetical protein
MRAAHGGADQEMKGFQSALQTHLQGVDGATLSMGVVPVMADHAQPSFLADCIAWRTGFRNRRLPSAAAETSENAAHDGRTHCRCDRAGG